MQSKNNIKNTAAKNSTLESKNQKIALPTHHELGRGSFGCVFESPLPCDTIESVTGLPVPATSVYKLMRAEDAAVVWARNANLVLKLDASSIFTVPLRSRCRVTDVHAARAACAPMARSDDIEQLAMQFGIVLTRFITWTQHVRTLKAALKPLYVLLRHCKRMNAAGVVHGDIKPDNILYFSSEARFKLIDYDFMASFYMDDAIPMQPMDVSAHVSRPVVDMMLTARPLAPGCRFAFNNVAYYFPPENDVASECREAALSRFPLHADMNDFVDACKQNFELRASALASELRAWLPMHLHRHLTILHDHDAYVAQFVVFVRDVLSGTWPDLNAIFRKGYYPAAHDAFHFGYVFVFLVGQYASREAQDVRAVHTMLSISNDLLCPNPRERHTIGKAFDAVRALKAELALPRATG